MLPDDQLGCLTYDSRSGDRAGAEAGAGAVQRQEQGQGQEHDDFCMPSDRSVLYISVFEIKGKSHSISNRTF